MFLCHNLPGLKEALAVLEGESLVPRLPLRWWFGAVGVSVGAQVWVKVIGPKRSYLTRQDMKKLRYNVAD